jgi:type IV pilus assembly protein PilM
MNWNPISKFLKGMAGTSGARFVLPPLVLEIEPDFVLGAHLTGRAGTLERFCIRDLGTGTIEPVSRGTNVANVPDLNRALASVCEVVGNGKGHVGVLLPDGAVRVVILDFETLPDDPGEAEALIRWRLKDSFPGTPEELRVSYQTIGRESNRVELLVAAVSLAVLREYAQGLGALNGGPVLVLPATLALVPLLSDKSSGELLVHVCSGWMTSVVQEGGRIRFWRTRDVRRETPEELAGEVIEETARVLASAGDRLKVDIQHVRLCLRPCGDAPLDARLAKVVSKDVTRLVPDTRRAEMLSEGEQKLFENFAAPVIGLVTNAGA